MNVWTVVIVLLAALVPGVVSADEVRITYEGVPITFDDEVFTEDEIRAALDLVGPPPMPPCADNCDVWVDSFNEPMGDYSGGGQSIKDMDNDVYLAGIEWEGEEVWLWT
jgi:hypothetical protein